MITDAFIIVGGGYSGCVCYNSLFFNKMWHERSDLNDDPLIFVIKTVRETNILTSKLLQEFISQGPVSLDEHRQSLINTLQTSESSRRLTYKLMNPHFLINNVYSSRQSVNELHRISFTRFRLSSHSLICEMGRWNKQGRGRLLPEERICQCGTVQSEQHVVERCPLTVHLRNFHGFVSINELFSDRFPPDIICKIIHDIFSVYT